MISFFLCLAFLIGGFFVYGKIVERNFGPDDRETPAVTLEDGVDYMVLPPWRVFLIQLLNIAGLGPIWGAVGGAMWGPAVFLWITLGTIFAGAVHDFAAGFISMRNKGRSVPEFIGKYMGSKFMLFAMRLFTVVLLFMVGVVFAKGPAGLLSYLFNPDGSKAGVLTNANVWLVIIILYYFVATFVPIDAIIGKIYPLFGLCLIVMALGVGGGIFVNGSAANIPEVWTVLGKNMHPAGTGAWPMMFISVACGAISGFHSTQSPIMARCCKSEKQARVVFYGAMVAEGVIALIWAAASCAIFPIVDGKMTGLKEAMALGQSKCIYEICRTTMGKVGVVLAMLGVIACPITSGDTAFRSARLTIADWFRFEQKSIKHRLVLSVPLLAMGFVVCQLDYNTVWNYFASTNQILAMIVLWSASVYLFVRGKNYWMTVIPATFMSAVTMTCVFSSDLYLGKLFGESAGAVGNVVGLIFAAFFFGMFMLKMKHKDKVDILD